MSFKYNSQKQSKTFRSLFCVGKIFNIITNVTSLDKKFNFEDKVIFIYSNDTLQIFGRAQY
jgi:hypothetical protein